MLVILNLAILVGIKGYLTMVLIYVSLMINDVELLSIYHFSIFVKWLLKHTYIFGWDIYLFYGGYLGVLFILGYKFFVRFMCYK